MGLFSIYFDSLVHFKYVYVALWTALLCIGVYFGPQLLNATIDSLEAPPGSPADVALKAYSEFFPFASQTDSMIVVVHVEQNFNNNTVLGPYLASLEPYFASSLSSSSIFRGVQGYYSFMKLAPTLTLFSSNFLSVDERYALIQIQFYLDVNDGAHDGDFVSTVSSVLNNAPKQDGFTLGLTGTEPLFADVPKGTEADLVKVDSVVLPCAFTVLCFYLRSFRLMVLPLISLLISILLSFSLMLGVTSYIKVASVAPSVMMSLSIAMCIDYNLFLLTRFREEILANRPPSLAVFGMLESAGHVVLVSGSTLAMTFAGLAFFPMDFLKAIGIAGSLAITMTLIVNLSFTPAMLLIFPNFFSNFSVSARARAFCPKFLVEDLPDEVAEGDGAGALDHQIPPRKLASFSRGGSPRSNNINTDDRDAPLLAAHHSNMPNSSSISISRSSDYHTPHNDAYKRAAARQASSFWFRSAQLSTTTRYSFVILIIVLAVLLPVSFRTLALKYTTDNAQIFPRTSPALEVFQTLQSNFPPGSVAHYKVLITTDDSVHGIMSRSYFDDVSSVVSLLLAPSFHLDLNSIQSVAFAGGQFVTFENATALLAAPFPCPFPKSLLCVRADSYHVIYNLTVAPDQRASVIDITTPFAPLSDVAETWVSDVRTLITNFETSVNSAAASGRPKLRLYLLGGLCETVDAIKQVFDLFPILIGVTVTLVFAIVAVVFKSVFVPFRLIFSIGLSITFTYGLAIYVFQDNDFDAFSSNLKSVHALYWLTPVMSFSILVGLGLDYDVFLYSRIVEYRQAGYTNRASILKGVYRTGSIITGAGLIMAISFGGLMLSEEMVLDQFGFMLSFAVLLDTFVVRTLAVPAILHLAGNVNYWPIKMPDQTKDENDHSDINMELEASHEALVPDPEPDHALNDQLIA